MIGQISLRNGATTNVRGWIEASREDWQLIVDDGARRGESEDDVFKSAVLVLLEREYQGERFSISGLMGDFFKSYHG